MNDYWKICIEEALSDLQIPVTEKQEKDLIEWIEGAHENYGLATGSECIPNPMATELRESQRKHKEELARLEAREDALKKSIASQYKSPVWVSVRDGRVEVEAQR